MRLVSLCCEALPSVLTRTQLQAMCTEGPALFVSQTYTCKSRTGAVNVVLAHTSELEEDVVHELHDPLRAHACKQDSGCLDLCMHLDGSKCLNEQQMLRPMHEE